MAVTRRNLMKSLGVLALTSLLPACFSNLYESIQKYVPVAILAFDVILEILAANGVAIASTLAPVVNAVKVALAEIAAAVAEYQHATGDGKPSAAKKVAEALRIAQNRLDEFWERLNLSSHELKETIRALLGIIISTLEGYYNRLPEAARSPVPVGPAVGLTVIPEARTLSQFRRDFNQALKDHNQQKYAI